MVGDGVVVGAPVVVGDEVVSGVSPEVDDTAPTDMVVVPLGTYETWPQAANRAINNSRTRRHRDIKLIVFLVTLVLSKMVTWIRQQSGHLNCAS